MYVRLTSCAVAALALGVISFTAPASTPNPVFWTWEEWDTNFDGSTYDGHMIPMVKAYSYNKTGAQAMDDAWTDYIDKYDLGAGQICIMIHGISKGHGKFITGTPAEGYKWPALFSHWCDSLTDSDNPAMNPPQGENGECERPTVDTQLANWWYTAWMSEGVDETSGWMTDQNDGFIQRYCYYQGLTGPSPTRFHFDSEWRPGSTSDGALAAFDYAKTNEDRWDGDIDDQYGFLSGYVYGFDDLYRDTRMDDLWGDADDSQWDLMADGVTYGVYDWDPSKNWVWWDDDPEGGYEGSNRPWVNWYGSVLRQACDGAMYAACYDPIHDAWGSTTLCSNYDTSLRIDEDHQYVTHNWHGGTGWGFLRWRGFGDLQAPVLYPVWYNHVDLGGGETFWGETMKLNRAKIDALIGSLDQGDDPTEITSWIGNITPEIGHLVWKLPDGKTCEDPGYEGDGGAYCYYDAAADDYQWRYKITKDDQRELLTMHRGRQLQEFLIWNIVEDSDWDAMADVIDQVWMWDIDDYAVTTGGGQSGTLGNMEFASEGDYFTVASATSGTDDVVDMYVEFDTADTAPGTSGFHVRVEGKVIFFGSPTNPEVDIQLALWDLTLGLNGGWHPILTSTIVEDARTQVFSATVPAGMSDYIDSSDIVKVRILCSSATDTYALVVDSVQISEADD